MRNVRGAYTLTELLIAAAVIGILAAVAIPYYLHALIRAQASQAVSDIHSLILAQEQYRLDQSGYPPLGVVRAARKTSGSASLPWLSSPIPYISAIPVDPFLKRAGRPYWMGYAHKRVASEASRIIAYTFSSTGPSKLHMLVIYWLQPDVLFNQYPFQSYDSSNGMTSMGEIVFWGGDSRDIHVLMNGREYDGRFPPDYGE
ncbi:MAG: prepilin-type N-terminal cleavage/methylation domain-containing protein [Candidatus Omnitrophica bacterium]|nr:prepilin-type N-terminal cleavage/methylation domain-containing protein [Candidatus Omnitrophota bacterium]